MNKWSLRGMACLLATTALASVAAAPAVAQTAEAGADGEIIVTAQKREERLQDVPLAITAITGEDLARSGATALRDVVSLAPSLSFAQSQSPVQSTISIRGVGTNGGVAGLDPSVGLYVDGVYLDRTSIGVGEFNDIERIEILRGPQGTLFGKNTPAGLVQFITQRPSYAWEGDFSATVGDYDARGLTGTISGPIIGDMLAFRLSGFQRTRDGFMTNTATGQQVNDQDAAGIRARLLWQPTPTFEALFSYENERADQNCCAAEFFPLGAGQGAIAGFIGRPFATPLRADDRVVSYNGDFAYSHVINAYALEMNWDLGPYRLTSITAVRDYDQRSVIDGDFSQLRFLDVIRGDRDHRQVSQELRIASPAENRLSFVAGLYYFRKEQEERGLTLTGPDTQAIFTAAGQAGLGALYATQRVIRSGSEIESDSYAVFGQALYQVTDTFDISAGLRYTYDDKSVFTFQTTTEPVALIGPPRNASAANDDGQWSGMVNARWRPSQDTMWYASLTRGYKAFGFNDGAINESLGQRRFFNAELSTGFEAGLRQNWREAGLQLNATVFHTSFEDYQASGFAPGNVFIIRNAAELTTQGVELEAVAQPTDGLTVSAAYTYLDATFDTFTGGPGIDGVSQVQDLSGRPLIDAPKHSLTLIGEYTAPLAGSLSWFARGEVSARSSSFAAQSLDPLLEQPDYALINARIGLVGESWSLEAWGRNLTDETVLYRGGTPPAIITAGSRIRFIGDPRTYGATLRYHF